MDVFGWGVRDIEGSRRAPKVLVADDQPDVRTALRLLLKGEGYETELAASPGALVALIEKNDFDAVLMDLNYARDTTSGREGLDLLARIREIDPALPVIVLTAWGSIELAVEAMRRGARDFVQKPWENARLMATLRTQIELGRALRQQARLSEENRTLRVGTPGELIARSGAMLAVVELLNRVGPSDACVLVTGENGTGKNLLARILHGLSLRSAGPFVTVDLASLAESVLESELFGHVKGAFTDAREDRLGRFELADDGTLFLDEIANVPLPAQAKLLRFLETGEFERVGSSRTRRMNVRLLAATNADLAQRVDAGLFRRDLFYRLNTVEVHLPPLRERREDIPLLAAHFLARHAGHYRKRVEGFAAGAMEALLAYSWPGNVRELDHAVERAVVLSLGSEILAADLRLTKAAGPLDLDSMSLEQVERLLIQKALERHGGNVTRAAQALDLSRSALYRRMSKHGL